MLSQQKTKNSFTVGEASLHNSKNLHTVEMQYLTYVTNKFIKLIHTAWISIMNTRLYLYISNPVQQWIDEHRNNSLVNVIRY